MYPTNNYGGAPPQQAYYAQDGQPYGQQVTPYGYPQQPQAQVYQPYPQAYPQLQPQVQYQPQAPYSPPPQQVNGGVYQPTVYQPQQQSPIQQQSVYQPSYQPEPAPAYVPGQPLLVQPTPSSDANIASPSAAAYSTATITPMNMEVSTDKKSDMTSSQMNGNRAKYDKLLCCIEPDANLTPEKLAKKYKYQVPLSILSCAASFILLILAILALVKITDFTDAYNDIVSTWNTQPVYDVRFVSTASPCPANYEEERARWPGTYDACVCPPRYASNSTDTSSCNADQSRLGCDSRTGYPAVDLRLHPLIRVCILRSGLSALDRTPPRIDGSCPTGTFLCASDTTNAFCEPNNVFVNGVASCPITDLAIAENLDASSYPEVTKTLIGMVDLRQMYQYTTRKGAIPESLLPLRNRSASSLPMTTLPITDVNVVSGEPCLITSTCYYSGRSGEYSSQEAAVKSGSSGRGFKLRGSSCSGCRSSGAVSPSGVDIRYVKAFERREKVIFSESGVPAAYTTTSDTYKYSLQTRSEVKWVPSCEKSRQDIAGQRDFVRHIKNFQITLLVVGILTFLIFSIAIPIVDYKTKNTWTDGSTTKSRIAWYVKTFFNVLFKCFVVAFTLATMFVSLSVLSYWTKVDGSSAKTTCSDPLSTEVFSVLTKDYRSLSYSNVGSTVAMGSSGVLDFLSSLIWMFSK